MAKRLFDVIFALLAIVLTLPILLIAGLLIWAHDRHPPVYAGIRVGRFDRDFRMFKLRTMIPGAHSVGGTSTSASDSRLTPLGTALRRFKLDELPQFWNVLKGQMSVVGPRPPLPEEVEEYAGWHAQRLLVKPGLTGLWQINGRSQLTFDEMVRLDLYYAEHWSPWLDTKIVLRTIPAVLRGRGAW